MAKILIVDDEPAMRLGLTDNLGFEGFETDQAADGEQALAKIRSEVYDLVLLDVMMPRMNGFDVCKTLRKEGNTTPIIFLTAKGEEIDRVLGFEFGADDYVQKPFSVRELIGRVKAILRRSEPTEAAQSVVNVGRLVVDFKKYTAHDGDAPVKMSVKEFEILAYLYRHRNEAVDRYELLKNVWGYEEQPTTRTVDNFIAKLRQKLEHDPANPSIILTIHGSGYKMVTG